MINTKKSKFICSVIFLGMLVFLLLQFRNVMVYFDDYGYYSLSYGVTSAKGGHEFTFSELISYLKIHYFDVNGRIPGYLIWLGLYILGGLTLVQCTAAVIVTLILYLIWKFIENEEYPILSAILVCAFYGLISINMHHQGTYWFAAFFQYVAPVAAIVGFMILYFKNRENRKVGTSVLLLFLTFIAAYSQEQLSVTVSFMMFLLVAYEFMKKKLTVWNFVYLIAAILCVAGLLLSPSAQNRANASAYGLIERIIYSTYNTIHTFYGADIRGLVCLLHLALFIFSAELFRTDKHIFKLMDLCGVVLGAITVFIYLSTPILDVLAQFTLNRYYLLIVCGVPCVAVLAIQIMRYYGTKGKDKQLLLFMTAVGSVGCLCFVPETPARLFISSWLLLFPLLADGIFHFNETALSRGEKMAPYLLSALCVVVCAAAIANAGTIYQGYAENGKAYRYNDVRLAEASVNGDSVVYLRTMPNADCAAALIYNEEVTYMKHWMKIYYNMSNDPKFYFNIDGTLETTDYVELENSIFVAK